MKKEKNIFNKPSGKILRFILERGEATIKDIEHSLDVTRNAIKPQVENLVSQGLLDYKEDRNERGRPYRVYYVTDKGRDSLPNQYRDLAIMLWKEISRITDSKKKKDLVKIISSKLADEYNGKLNGTNDKERLERFVEILNKQGIPAEIKETKNQMGWDEYNCPYYMMAKENPEICAMELDMLEKILGSPVQRNEWLLAGANGCRFQLCINENKMNKTNI